MLLVALVAVPLLISEVELRERPSPFDLGAQTSARARPETENAVVAYHPGVRNFKSRLNDLSAKNPFIQQFTALPVRLVEHQQSTQALTPVDHQQHGLGGGTSVGGRSAVAAPRRWRRQQSPGRRPSRRSTPTSSPNVLGRRGGTSADHHEQHQPVPVPAEPGQAGARLPRHRSGGTQAALPGLQGRLQRRRERHLLPDRRRLPAARTEPRGGADLVYGPDGKTYHVQVTKIKRVTSSKPPS